MTNFSKLFATIFAAVVLFTSFSLYSQEGFGTAYRLRPLDTVEMRVFQEPDMTTVYKIGTNGMVVLPLISAVKIEGLTIQEAQRKIKELYEKDYLVNADVTIFIAEYSPQRVYVTGQVNQPGPVMIPGEESMTLTKAVAAAGGTTRLANTRSIAIKRKMADGTTKVFDVDLRSILNSTTAKDFPLYDGDTIDVPEAIF